MSKTTGTAMRPLTVLAAVAVASAVLSVAAPAAAQENDPMPETLPAGSACVGDALLDSGFTDIERTDAAYEAVNCLAHYAITVGTTPTTYGPSDSTTRAQMALFLHRTATLAGVSFGAAADDRAAMFSDIDGQSDAIQEAIKALYAKGIVDGRAASGAPGAPSDDTYVPGEPINRAEMARYLVNLVRLASPDLFNTDGTLSGVEQLDRFDDAERHTPAATSTAIAQAYELGITAGRDAAAHVFGPDGPVTRWQMALFLTRALAHTPLRPAGASLYTDGASVTVSVRDTDGNVPSNRPYVDVFVADLDEFGDAFDDDGECDASVVRAAALYWNSHICEIDRFDERVDADGDLTLDFSDDLTSDGVVVWIWTGDVGDEADIASLWGSTVVFGDDTLPPPPAEQLTVTYAGVEVRADGTPFKARRGSDVSIRMQLQGRYGDDPLRDVPSPAGGASYAVTLSSAATDGTVIETRAPATVTLDADGSAELSLPSAFREAPDGHTVTVTVTPNGAAPAAVLPAATVEFMPAAARTVASIEATAASVWRELPPAGGRGSNSVEIVVYDQFGRRLGTDMAVVVASSLDTADQWISRGSSTARSGRAVVRYEYTPSSSPVGVTETLTVGLDSYNAAEDSDNDGTDDEGRHRGPPTTDPAALCDGDPVTDSEDSVHSGDVCVTVAVHWAPDAADTDGGTARNVLHADLARETVIVDVDGAPHAVSYADATDRDAFSVAGGANRDATSAELMTAFVSALERCNAADAASPCKLMWDTSLVRWYFDLTPG